jgi:hypothetical protein
MADVKFVDGLWLIKIPKGLVAMTHEEMKRALKRARAYRRAQALKARLGKG